MAVAVGFEPTEGVNPRRSSRRRADRLSLSAWRRQVPAHRQYDDLTGERNPAKLDLGGGIQRWRGRISSACLKLSSTDATAPPQRIALWNREMLKAIQHRHRAAPRLRSSHLTVRSPVRIASIVRCPRDVGLGVVVAYIFISYATPDRAVADEVSVWLRAAGHELFLDHDLSDGISVGEDWKQRLYRELREVDVVIGVVTSSFVASNWCSAELGIADALGCRLMPLRAETGVVHPLMQNLQYADYRADPPQAREHLLQALRLLEDGGDTWREGDNPFPGLEPFTAALSRVFFGRAAEAREVGNRLRAMGSTGGMLVIVGPSGCGKSSLLNAAVVPQLSGDPTWLMVPGLVPGSDPSPELARTLAITANRLELDWSVSDVRSRLEGGTDGLRCVVDDLLATRPVTHQRRLLVTVDQAEELFTRTTPAALRRFTQLLSGAMTCPVQVMAAMRSEFLDDLRDLPELAGMPIEAYVLAPLDREMLRDVIEQPAKMARLHLDDGLAAALVADTHSGEALPLLAFILRQLADGLPSGGTLTLARYNDLGGVQGALTRHADTALEDAIRASGLTEREVLVGLTRLVTSDETGRRARRRITLTGLPEPLRVALQVFVDRRLLLSDTDDDGQVWLTMAHEALLTGWRPLDTATAGITTVLRTARALEQEAAEWNSAGRSEHYLWDAERLTVTLTSLGMTGDDGKRDPGAPPSVELDYDSLAFLKATEQYVRASQERERRRRTRTSTVLSALLVLMLIAAGIAVWQQQRASLAQRITIARDMLAQADRTRDRDPRGALQLDVAARLFDASLQTTVSLTQTLTTTSHFRTLRGHSDRVISVVFSPDGHTLVTASADRTIRLWDVSDRDRPRPLGLPLTGHTDRVNSVAFSPDGHTLVTASTDRTIRLWDVSDRDRPRPLGLPLTGHTDRVNSVAFSPDGHTFAAASADQTELWDVSDRDRPRPLGSPLTGHTDRVNSVAFSPDGHTLVTASTDRTIRLWDVSDRDRPRPLGLPLTGHTDTVNSVAFSPDGHTFAAASADQTELWDVSDRDRPRPLGSPLTGHTDTVNSVAFSPDGHTFAAASADQTVRLWDVSDRDRPRPLGPPLTGHTGAVNGMAFAPEGRSLVTVSSDQTVILWNLSDRSQPRQLGPALTGHTNWVKGVAFAPDGRTLATAGFDQTVRLWDVSDRDRPRPLGPPLTGHTKGVNGVAFAPDGRTLATAGFDQTVRLWDVSDRDRPRPLGPPLTGHTNAVFNLAFAPDGRTLATASIDQTVRLWDVSDRDRPRPLGPPLTGHTGPVLYLAFAPDGRTLATAGFDQTVRLWDVSDRDRPRPLGPPLTGHTNAVFNLAFSPDGRTLATASSDQTARLWDVSDRHRPRPLGPPLTGHTGPVYGVAFAPDGRTLATASSDQTARLWDVSDRHRPWQLGRPLTGHSGLVFELAFSPDGRTLATASADQTVILWELPHRDTFPGGEVQEACIRAGGPIDKATWDLYAPDVSYQDTCDNR
jgi:WD40 repeat protein